jgi:hypothetical protein
MISGILMLGMFQVAAAQTNTDGRSKPSWFQRLWPFHKKKAPPPAPTVKGPSAVETAAAVRAREKAAYLRRIAVCDNLRAIAVQTNNNELYRKADQLDQRAFAIYKQHLGQAPGEIVLQAEEPSLQHRLGNTGPVGQRLMPAQRASGSQASLRED